jgi:hypothetical protein
MRLVDTLFPGRVKLSGYSSSVDGDVCERSDVGGENRESCGRLYLLTAVILKFQKYTKQFTSTVQVPVFARLPRSLHRRGYNNSIQVYLHNQVMKEIKTSSRLYFFFHVHPVEKIIAPLILIYKPKREMVMQIIIKQARPHARGIRKTHNASMI